MASLSAVSAATAAFLCQEQHVKSPRTVSFKSFLVRCLPLQNNTVVCLNNDPCHHAAIVLDTESLEKSDDALSHKNHALLEQLAFEEAQKNPSDRHTYPTARAVANAIKEATQVSDVDAALHDLRFHSLVYTKAIRTLGDWNKVHAAVCLVQWLQRSSVESPNVYIFSSIIAVMRFRRDFTHFDFVMDSMQKDNIELNLVMYNNIIECYELQGSHNEAMKYFLELVQKGLVPDQATFKAILSGPEIPFQFRRALDDFSTAMDVLQKHDMDDAAAGLRQTVSDFCSRILCSELQAGKEPDYIKRLFEMAEASMIEFSASHYDKILWALASHPKDFVVAKFVLERRRKLNPPLNVDVCNHVLRFMGKAKKWWAALELFEQMIKEGPSPDAKSHVIMRSQFNFLLKSSKDRGTCHWNVQLLQKMEAHGIEPDLYAWNITLVACAVKVDPNLAMHVFKWMIEKGYQPNVLSYGALLTTLEKGCLNAEAERVWEHMRRLGVEPNVNAYTIMISVYGALQKHEKFKSLLDEMYASGVRFTLITYNALLTECAKAADGEGALKWMKDIIKAGFKPDAISYNQLVIALSVGGQVELAKDMHIRAKYSNLVLSPAACKSLVKACKLHGIEFDPEQFSSEPRLEEHSNLVSEPNNMFNDVIQPADLSEADFDLAGDDLCVSSGNVTSSQFSSDMEVEDIYVASHREMASQPENLPEADVDGEEADMCVSFSRD